MFEFWIVLFSESSVIYYHQGYHFILQLVQKAFVICRLKIKTDEKNNVATCDEGDVSSYAASDLEIQMPGDTIPEVRRSMPCGYFIFPISTYSYGPWEAFL